MIKLAFLEYKDNSELDLSITRYANDNLEEIIRFALDYISDSSDIERFSPKRLFAKAPDECLLCIEELLSFAQDSAFHKDLRPIYQFILFRILTWYIDVAGEIEKDDLTLSDSLLLFEMDDSLKNQIIENYGYSGINRFSDIKNYLYEFFDDWDFRPDFLAMVVQLYIDRSPIFDNFTSLEELENYVELMDGDTLRKYQSICAQRNTKIKQQDMLWGEFDTKLKKALLFIQRDSKYWSLDENSLNDSVCSHLGMLYDVHDQSRQGLSLSQKNPGEIDFLVFYDQEPIAIMEALKLDSVNKSYLNDHITKLLINYDPQGHRRTYLLMYVTTQDFGAFWDGFCDYISTYSFEYPVTENLTELQSPYTEFRMAYTVLMRSGRPVVLSFYAIHIPKKEEDNE